MLTRALPIVCFLFAPYVVAYEHVSCSIVYHPADGPWIHRKFTSRRTAFLFRPLVHAEGMVRNVPILVTSRDQPCLSVWMEPLYALH